MSEILLTELRKADSPILFEWINNRSLVINNNNYSPIHELNHDNWFNAILQRNEVRIFAIRTKFDDKLIGVCQLFNIDFINRNAELQIRIGSIPHQGKGMGRQAIASLLEFGFRDLGLHRVYLRVFSTNVNAVKAYEKIGFITEGVLKDAAFIDGNFVDIIFMAVLNRY